VLVRDYFDILSESEKEFCKNTVLGYASLVLQENYRYQISDGMQSAISVLPLLLDQNSKKSKCFYCLRFSMIILLIWLKHDLVFSIVAIQKLWKQI
jgi:hypothetical protein